MQLRIEARPLPSVKRNWNHQNPKLSFLMFRLFGIKIGNGAYVEIQAISKIRTFAIKHLDR